MNRGRHFFANRAGHMGVWSLAVLSFTAPTAVLAQTAGADLEEVVVTGYRQSLSVALDAKKQSAEVIDQIVAEDIAKFPDLNLSESIQRIPGVSISREAGEGRQITVRGLGAQFTRVRINGMEGLTTTGGTDATGGNNRSRSFDFNIFASELFNSITVRKTSSASVEEGSLGATVDLRVARPFDYSGFTFAASGQLGYNDLSEETDPRGALLISNTFGDGKFGALLSVAYSERNVLDVGASAVRWQSGGGWQSNATSYTTTELASAFRPRIPRYDYYENSQERLGVTASFQFKPSDASELSLDVLYSKLDATRSEAFLESANFSSSLSEVDVLDAYIDPTNSLVYGRFDDVDIRSEQRYDELSTTFKQITLEGTQKLGDALTLHALVGRADSSFDNPIQTTLLWNVLNVDGYSYDYRGNSRVPVFGYGSSAIADPSFWQFTAASGANIRLRPQTTDNTLDNVLADLTWEMSDSLSVSGGVQFKKYTFDTTEKRRSNGTTANLEGSIPASAAAIPTSAYFTTISLNGLTWVVPNVKAAGQLMGLYDPALYPLGIEPILGNNYSVEEKDSGAFVQVDFKTMLGGMNLRGNVGVRYVKTKLEASGYSLSSGAVLKNSGDHSYSDTLPSLNLALDLTDEFIIRFGAAKVMTRPNLGQLNPSASVTVSGSNKTVTAGNPELNPFRATAVDLSFEWYFAKESLLGLGLFYKDINSFVQTIRKAGTFSENPLGLPDSVAVAACGTVVGCSPSSNDWQFSIPGTTPGGTLKGAELSFQMPFTFLPGLWKDFGTQMNYTYVESDITYRTFSSATTYTDVKERLTNLSNDAYNVTLYYDNGTFSARASLAYRGDYLTTVPGRNSNNVEGTAETTTIDASASWNVNDHISVSLEGLNLTDEYDDQWVDSVGDRSSYYHHSGRTFMLGARYKF